MSSCDCNGCVSTGRICAPKGDDTRIVFTVLDNDGDEFDLTSALEIVFIVADSLNGDVRIVKKLSAGQISIPTNGYQFALTVTAAETASLPRSKSYYEAQVTTAAGNKKTVSRGLFRATETRIKDLP